MKKILSLLFVVVLATGIMGTKASAVGLGDIALWNVKHSDSSENTVKSFEIDGVAPWDNLAALGVNDGSASKYSMVYNDQNQFYNVFYNHFTKKMTYWGEEDSVTASGTSDLYNKT